MTTWISEFTVPGTDQDGLAGINFEDGGDGAIMYSAVDTPMEIGGDGAFFVRFQSWDDRTNVAAADKHQLFRSLMGRRVRVTIETIDDEPDKPSPSTEA